MISIMCTLRDISKYTPLTYTTTRTQRIGSYMRVIEKIMIRDLVECRNALNGFKSTNQERTEVHYSTLKRQYPVYVDYDNILKKLHTIWTLPGKLDSFIETNTVDQDQAKDIQKTCRSILNNHESSDYAPLFKTSKYFSNAGNQRYPEYGLWTYNGKEYEMEAVITDVQDIMKWFIQKLS